LQVEAEKGEVKNTGCAVFLTQSVKDEAYWMGLGFLSVYNSLVSAMIESLQSLGVYQNRKDSALRVTDCHIFRILYQLVAYSEAIAHKATLIDSLIPVRMEKKSLH